MAKHIHQALDEIFTETDDRAVVMHHLKMLVKCIGEAYCKQSARVYGLNKYSTQQLIKAALAEQEMPMVEFEVRGFGKQVKV